VKTAAETVIGVPMADGRWVAMTTEEFDAALRRATALGLSPAPAAAAPVAAEALLTSAGMAELLGCNDTLLEQMSKDGRIPSVRIGRLLRFKPSAVLAALQARP
jgi:excisionase family DNA binding protein